MFLIKRYVTSYFFDCFLDTYTLSQEIKECLIKKLTQSAFFRQ